MKGGAGQLTGVLVALLMLMVAPVARADEGPLEVGLPKGELGAIAYGGGRVLWATQPASGPVRIYSASPAGGAPILLASIRRAQPNAGLTVSLAAGAAGYIVSLRDSNSFNSDPYGGEIFEGEVVAVGGFDGSLHTVLRCRPGRASREGEFPPVATAAGDQLFAFGGVACGAPASIDTVTPGGVVTPVPHAPRFTWNAESHEVPPVNLTLAGSTLAYTASDADELPLIGIDDLATGGFEQIDPAPGSSIASLSARADGTVFATGTVFASKNANLAEPASVFAVDPGQSGLRPLTGLLFHTTIALLAGGERLLLNSYGYPDLALASASGQRLGPVGAPGVSGTHTLLAFNGEQAVYTSSTCSGAAEVTILTLPAAGPAGSTKDGCPMSVTSSKITVGPSGRAAVRLSCPLGCEGRLDLEVSAPAATRRELARLLDHEGFTGLAIGGFKLAPGSGLVHMRLDRYARQFLARHHGRLTAELTTDVTDPETTASIARAVKVLVRRG
jgi:hypothetical protein